MRQSVERKRPALAVALTIFLTLAACSSFGQHFNRTDLTANSASVASVPNLDPNLVNAWGLSRSSGSPWWVSDNGTGLSTLYDASGMPQSLVVTIPVPSGQSGPATPTGNVFNFTIAFNVKPGAKAFFIFVTEDGTISGWNPTVDLNHAILKVNRSGEADRKSTRLNSSHQIISYAVFC